MYAILVVICLVYTCYTYLIDNWNNWFAYVMLMLPLALITWLPFGLGKTLISALPLPIVYVIVVPITFVVLYYAGKTIETLFKKTAYK
jgi:hypothetical protein